MEVEALATELGKNDRVGLRKLIVVMVFVLAERVINLFA